MLISANAIVLRTIPYGDTSLISRLFTENEGKVTIMAKGARRPKNTVAAALEPMNHLSVQFYHKNSRDIQILKDAAFLQNFTSIRNDLSKIVIGLTIVELLDKSTRESNPAPILYRLGWRVLENLDNSKVDHWLLFAFFLFQHSLRIGFMPELSSCTKCRSQIKDAVFDNSTGELVCQECNTDGEFVVDHYTLTLLQAMSTFHMDNLDTIRYKKRSLVNSIKFLDSFSSFHIEGLGRVKSMNLLRDLLYG